jgi:hypothetical protein
MISNLDYLKELGLSTSIHAIPSIIRSPRLITKILWSIFFLLAFCLCLFSLSENLANYLRFEVTTSVKYVYEKNATFPMITLCNKNSFTTNYALELLNQVIKRENINNITSSNSNIDNKTRATTLSQLFAKSYLNNNQKKKLSFQLEEMLIICQFSNSDCTAQDFEWYYDYLYGNCYKFNSGKNLNEKDVDLKKIKFTSSFEGLRLVLFSPKPEQDEIISTSYGFHLSVTNQSHLSDFSQGFDVGLGTESLVKISKTIINKVPSPYSDCNVDLIDGKYDKQQLEMINAFKIMNKTYRKNDCIELCKQKIIIENCHCHIPYFYSFSNQVPCVNFSQHECFYSYNKNLFNDVKYDECVDSCPLECETVDYSVTISNSITPTRSFFENILMNKPIVKNKSKTLDYDSMKSQFAYISLYFGDLRHTKIQEIPNFTFIDFLCNIGN